MKKILLLLLIFCCFIFCYGQNPLVKIWDYRYGGTSWDVLNAFHRTSDNGFILGGYSISGLNGDKTQPSWGASDYWVVKTDSNGIKQWDARFGGTASDDLYSIQQTNDRGYILGGVSSSDSSGDKTQPSWRSGDYWIVKTDSSGNKQWDKRFGGTDYDGCAVVQQTSDGGYIVGGTSLSGVGGDKTQPDWDTTNQSYDYWIVKTDSLGNYQWDKRFGGTANDILNTLQQTSDGGYILGGQSNSEISGDKTDANWDTTNGTNDYWVIKIDSSGIKQWDKTFGGTGDDRLFSMFQTADRGFILAGLSNSEISGNKTLPTWGGSTDYWIIKIDSLGVKQWEKVYGGTLEEDMYGYIYPTIDGGYLISGTSYSNISGDKTEDNLGVSQTWVVKIDSLGIKQWDKTILTSATQPDGNSGAIEIPDGCFAIGNFTKAGIGGYKTQPNWDVAQNTPDYWIVKFCDTTLTTSANQLPLNSFFSIYPNPFTNELTIKGGGRQGSGGDVVLYDVAGKEILHQKTTAAVTKLNTEGIAAGFYLLRVESKEGVWNYKVVKQ